MEKKTEIKLYEKNAKIHNDKQLELLAKIVAEIGWRQSVEVNQQGVIVVGHGRYLAWEKYKDKYKLPDIWVVDDTGKTVMGKHDEKPLTEQQEKMWRIADNQVNAMTGLDMKLAVPELKLLGEDMLELTGLDSFVLNEEEKYTKKITAPVYEPKNELPEVVELFEKNKTMELLDKIEKTKLSKEDKDFLKEAAHRFTRFDYQKIADYYANVKNKELKDLIEELALVIIDYDKAIELGFVNLATDLIDMDYEE